MKIKLIFILLLAMANISFAQSFVEIPYGLTIKNLDSLKLETGKIYYVPDKYTNRIIGISKEGKQLSKGDIR